MSKDDDGGPETNSRSGWGFWGMWLGAILITYVLSSGPAMLMLEKGMINYNSRSVAGLYFVPFRWAYEDTPLKRPLGMYWHLWAPQMWDRQGEFQLLK